MADIINLRRARKAKARTEAAKDAALNRAIHGRSKGARDAADAARDRAERTLDQHQLDKKD